MKKNLKDLAKIEKWAMFENFWSNVQPKKWKGTVLRLFHFLPKSSGKAEPKQLS